MSWDPAENPPRIVTGDDVRVAVEAVLTAWLPNVLAVLGGLETPKSHKAPTIDAARLDAAALPILVVAVAGLVSPPTRDQYGVYTGRFDTLVNFLLRSASGTYEDTARDVRRYAAAVRTVFIEHNDLDGYAVEVEVTAEKYDDADPKVARTLAEGQVTCVVTVADINRLGATFTDPTSAAHAVATETTVTVHPAIQVGATHG